MPKRIPIKAAREFAASQGLSQIIVLGWDGKLTHVVTYGKTLEDCDQAALVGNRIKEFLGWPKDLSAEPSRVQRLKDQLRRAELERAQALALVEVLGRVTPFAACAEECPTHECGQDTCECGCEDAERDAKRALAALPASLRWRRGETL